MAKIGRNDFCLCGSGKKYKKCCMARDEEVENLAPATAAPVRTNHGLSDEMYNEMVAASNAAVHLIDAGKLDEAERAAHDLLERFPNVCDGYARLGLIHELRGDNRKAIECYGKVIGLAREHPDINEPVSAKDFQALIDRLEQPMAS
jgi:tetratricopeptide (TPR) repeat protein